MRRTVEPGVVLLSALIWSIAGLAAEENTSDATKARIDREVERFESGSDSSAAMTKLFSWGADSGVLTLFAPYDGYSKLVVQVVGEAAGRVTEYYYRNRVPEYVVEVCNSFRPPGGQGGSQGCSSLDETRYYLSGGTVVVWLTGSGVQGSTLREVDADARERAETAARLTKEGLRWRAFLDSPVSDYAEFAGTASQP